MQRKEQEVYGLYDVSTRAMRRFETPEALAFAVKNTHPNTLQTCFCGKRSEGTKGMVHAEEWLQQHNKE